MNYNFFLERVLNRLIDSLEKKGYVAKPMAAKNPQTLASNLNFRISIKDKNLDKLKDIAEIHLSAQKQDQSTNSDVQIKVVVKDRSHSEEINQAITEFSKPFSNLGFANSPEFSFQKSTEPRPSQTPSN